MNQEEKINYLRIALALQNICVRNETADRIIETYEKVLKKGGDFTISDAVDIECRLNEKYAKTNLENTKSTD